ncbi:hypothetical protein ABZ016_18955 [Streptomyces sp. NPDC006372]|uniref:hypothetical protein n=1 Tax=Streptomyces sp. NPDC006372 TaxID=3155599 RepID=UPI0033AEFFB0
MAGLVYGFISLLQQERNTDATVDSGKAATDAENREKRKDEEEKKKEAGPPVEQAPGAPNFYGVRFAFPDKITDLQGGGEAGYGTQEYSDWFARNQAVRVGIDVYRVTLSPLHEGTVVIQNMRISDRKCEPTRYSGTAVVPPPIGDGGDDVEPKTVGFDLTEPAPRPRIVAGRVPQPRPGVEVWKLKGNAFSEGVYLDGGEQGDARTFDLFFFAGESDCEFRVEVNITSGTEDAWYPLKLGKRSKVEVAGQANRYESVVLPRSVDYTDPVQNELKGPGNPFDILKIEKGSF